MRILVVGGNGQLGSDMVLQARAAGHEALGLDVPEIDILDEAGLRRRLEPWRPEAIVNAAAYTAVDECEKRADLAHAVNAAGVANLARCARGAGAVLAHISTDYVFDGTKKTPYVETDAPNPQTVYGQSKLAGEQQLARIHDRHFIFRIAWLYGLRGANFVRTIGRAARKNALSGAPLKVVNDQHGTPTWTVAVCRQILSMLDSRDYGVYHCTSEGECTWFDFARTIVDRLSIPAEVVPCATAEYPRPAPRPAYSVLENRRLKELGRNAMPDWREAFERFVVQIPAEGWFDI